MLTRLLTRLDPRLYARPSARSCLKTGLLCGLLLCVLLFDGQVRSVGALLLGSQVHVGAEAASRNYFTLRSMREVMPEADSFSEKSGEPLVVRAYKTDEESGEQTLIGYVFLTSDVPPLVNGYSGPIKVLVGLGLDGYITRIKVVAYRESLRSSWGDFLDEPGFQEQYFGMHATDDFRVDHDVDGMAKATVTVKAMTRGIRYSIRKVAQAYLR